MEDSSSARGRVLRLSGALVAGTALFVAGFVVRSLWGDRGLSGIGYSGIDSSRRIDHVVMIVKENHTYDNYFGDATAAGSYRRCTSFTEQQSCTYAASDLPAYHRYAAAFGSADRYFVDVRGPSWPNHMMMVAAQTPLWSNPTPTSGPAWTCPQTCYDFPTIGDSLSAAGVSWRNYGEAIFNPFRAIRHLAHDEIHNRPESDFFEDVTAGLLPAVVWVRPSYPESEHPGYDVRQGESTTVDLVNAIMRTRYWRTTAIFVVWDDAGTSTDHLTPPVVERAVDGSPLRFGLRAPFLVISPYTPAGYVSHRTLSHVSLLRYLEVRFGLEPLTGRDAQAQNLDDFFDFGLPARPPLLLKPGAA